MNGVAVRIRKAKTGRNQWVMIRDKQVASLVTKRVKAMRGRSGKTRIFPFSPEIFRKKFKGACAALGLSEKYVPHSLRHGGATHDFLAGKSVDYVVLRGRWAEIKSARRYIQQGRALLMAVKVPRRVAKLARKIAPQVERLMVCASQRH